MAGTTTNPQPKPHERPSHADARPGATGFCLGMELFLSQKRITAHWVMDAVDGCAAYFLSEWPGFSRGPMEYRRLEGRRAVVLAEFPATDVSPQELQRAQMWWRGIPVFGVQSEAIVMQREIYETREEAQAALLPSTMSPLG